MPGTADLFHLPEKQLGKTRKSISEQLARSYKWIRATFLEDGPLSKNPLMERLAPGREGALHKVNNMLKVVP